MSMPVTTDQLTDFCNFAIAHATQGDPSSVSQLATRWEAEREYAETVEDIRIGLAQYEQGLGRPVAEVFAEIRQQLNLTK